MTKTATVYIVIVTALCCSCANLQNLAKYELANGKYKLKTDTKKYTCYVQNTQDSILLYQLPINTFTSFPNETAVYLAEKNKLIKSSVDIDILTAIFKIRPKAANFLPAQLNANFNGNIYLGYRNDIYQIHYKKNPMSMYRRQINHFGFSGGLFLGLGNTAMNPTNTNNAISSEYDGIVLQKGIAAIVAINKLTVGISLGFDRLLDNNNKVWLYNNKPWYGLMLGLNLN